jgi:hypothetical protein
MSEKKSLLTVDVSVKDMEIFQTVLSYTEALIELLSAYPLPEVDERKLNEISGEFFEVKRQVSE